MSSEAEDTLYVVIPAYNEEKNIISCINDWYPIIESHNSSGKSRLVVINDGSKDDTYEILLEASKTLPLLVPLSKENGGHGSTVLHGYRFAIESGATFVFQTDSDGQTNPDEFEQFWENRNLYDAVIGNRVVRGDGQDRKFVENTVCRLLRLFFGVKVEDANAPFRLLRCSVLAKYLPKLPKDYNLPNIMITTYLVYFNERVKFIPITFKPRQAGVNSINIKRIVKIGWHALGDFYKLRRNINKEA